MTIFDCSMFIGARTQVYEFVVGAIIREFKLEPTGRPAKSTSAIVDKLRRESIRLTQIQDIAGCRVIVEDILAQDSVVSQLKELFDNVVLIDRRTKPSHGYRAVHVIVRKHGKQIEIQVRTLLQHLWAELSEKLSDVIDKDIKYGGGNKELATALATASENVQMHELAEIVQYELRTKEKELRQLVKGVSLSDELDKELVDYRKQLEDAVKMLISDRQKLLEGMRKAIATVAGLKES